MVKEDLNGSVRAATSVTRHNGLHGRSWMEDFGREVRGDLTEERDSVVSEGL